MIRGSLGWLALGAALGLSVMGGCADDDVTSSTQDVTQSPATCTAVFRFLQKDAYKDTAGVSESGLWPPHTTTVLDLSCGGEVTRSAFQANHGTEPGAIDANGDVILTEVATREADLTQDQADALFAAFETCSCDGATSFLSLDSLDEELVGQLVQEVATYLNDNLTCPDGVGAVVSDLEAGDVEAVLAALPACTWNDGTDLLGGMDQALQALATATGDTLADFHVCNNDAQLHAQLFERFVETGEVTPCNADQALCRGPAWFYTP